ncbi:SDR family NAD(P)-dependent oxidoreductase [Actinoplanes sp. NPDC049265]|uniref:SDR family NAD(P)-dependent oxidoreductase n=1 Tax=Actinoplanes sp. NPDC049265 TaxID=3363902 RepID=UPI003714ABF0
MTERRAVIIGNSDGIGLALTRRLRDDGWTVTGVSRSPGELTDVVADVTDPAYPARLADAVRDGVDLCVYAAGTGELLDLTGLAAQTRALEVNLVGAARTLEVVLPGMIAAGRGHVVGLSSLADAAPNPAAPGYAASKAGLTSYLLGLRAAVRRHGVAVSVIRFGFVDTKMAKSPVKPMMITVDRAVDVVLRALRTRAAVISHPRSVAAVATVTAPLVRATTRR